MSGKTSLTNFIQGGQAFNLSVNMFIQNIKTQAKYLGLAVALACLSIAYLTSSETERKWSYIYAKSYISSQYLGLGDRTTIIELSNGKKVNQKHSDLVKNAAIIRHKNSLISNLEIAAISSVFLCIFFIYLHTKFLVRKGEESIEDEHIRGAKISNKKELILKSRALISRYKKERGESTMSICDVPLVQGSETAGIATVGSPGVGKSETHIDIAAQLRSKNSKAMVYDLGGQMTKKFYRPDKDIILNPYDVRCAQWDVWCEGKEEQLYAAIAEALIPDDGGDPIWYQAPRITLKHIMKKLGEMNASPDMSHLKRILFKMDSKRLAGVLNDTDAKSVFNLDSEKMAASIAAIMATYTESFSLLESGANGFSIVDWVKDDDDDRWVFVTCRDVDKATLRPLITVWFEIFSRSVLSLEPSYSRRIGCLLDELPTLQRIPSLENALNTGRKFGLVPVIGFQAESQMNTTYGEEETKTIMGAIPSYVAFRCNGIKAAESSAEELGKSDLKQASEGSTVGQTASRDAQSLNRQNNSDKKIVMASEVQALQDLECFLRFSRGLPIAKVEAKKRNIPDTQQAFILKKQENLIESDTLEPVNMITDIDEYLNEIDRKVTEEEDLKRDYIKSVTSNGSQKNEQSSPMKPDELPIKIDQPTTIL